VQKDIDMARYLDHPKPEKRNNFVIDIINKLDLGMM
jgi:hypothetical protein